MLSTCMMLRYLSSQHSSLRTLEYHLSSVGTKTGLGGAGNEYYSHLYLLVPTLIFTMSDTRGLLKTIWCFKTQLCRIMRAHPPQVILLPGIKVVVDM
ncbi:hypothetical protein CFP56_009603 [Quercus suber]|uniref:Uncharacterized protein n=1 Tax=Quercus suber TaxID=58331 RepID=A0AAW0M5F7_QUESU